MPVFLATVITGLRLGSDRHAAWDEKWYRIQELVHRFTFGRLCRDGWISQPGGLRLRRPKSLSIGKTRVLRQAQQELFQEADMSTTTTSSRTSYVQWLIESRPSSLTWSRSSPPPTNQPPLDLVDHEPDVAEAAAPDDQGVR